MIETQWAAKWDILNNSTYKRRIAAFHVEGKRDVWLLDYLWLTSTDQNCSKAEEHIKTTLRKVLWISVTAYFGLMTLSCFNYQWIELSCYCFPYVQLVHSATFALWHETVIQVDVTWKLSSPTMVLWLLNSDHILLLHHDLSQNPIWIHIPWTGLIDIYRWKFSVILCDTNLYSYLLDRMWTHNKLTGNKKSLSLESSTQITFSLSLWDLFCQEFTTF